MISVREINKNDASVIHGLVLGLAKYEKEPEGVLTTVEDYQRFLNEDNPPFSGFIAEDEGKPIGMAIWDQNFSTWTGKNMFLEDFFVLPEYRSKGVGRMLLREIFKTAIDNGYYRIRWDVIDFNEPAKKIYRKLGAKRKDTWEHWRLEGDEIQIALDSL